MSLKAIAGAFEAGQILAAFFERFRTQAVFYYFARDFAAITPGLLVQALDESANAVFYVFGYGISGVFLRYMRVIEVGWNLVSVSVSVWVLYF